jgi:hypothetical protein
VPVLRLNSFIHELDTDADRNSFQDYEYDMAYPDEPWPEKEWWSGRPQVKFSL